MTIYHGLMVQPSQVEMGTHFGVADGEKRLSAQQLPCLLNYHSHCSTPAPTRYLDTPTVSIWPLAMVGNFPNQTNQYFKNFPNERETVPTLQQGKTKDKKLLALTSYIFHHVKKLKIFCERMKLTYQNTHNTFCQQRFLLTFKWL